MAEVNKFNQDLDKITERETVYNFIERLSLGEDLENYDYADINGGDSNKKYFKRGTKFINKIMRHIVRTLPHFIQTYADYSEVKCLDFTVKAGVKEFSIKFPSDITDNNNITTKYTLVAIIHEETGFDIMNLAQYNLVCGIMTYTNTPEITFPTPPHYYSSSITRYNYTMTEAFKTDQHFKCYYTKSAMVA